MSLSDKIGFYNYGEVLKVEDVKEAVKELIDNFVGDNIIDSEINYKIILEIFGEELVE